MKCKLQMETSEKERGTWGVTEMCFPWWGTLKLTETE